MKRIIRIRYGFWFYGQSDTAVLRFDTDFNKMYGVIIFNHIMRHKTIRHNGIIVYC